MARARYTTNRAGVMSAFRAAVTKGLTRSAGIVQQEVRKQLSKGGAQRSKNFGVHAPPGQPPFVSTGHLRRSWQMGSSGAYYNRTAIADPVRPRVVVGSNMKYARIHEFGGVIKAKRAKNLVIPLNYEAFRIQRDGNWKGVFRVGNALAKRSGRGKLKFLFALKKSVRIPPRPYVRPGVRLARPRVLAEFAPAVLMRGMNVRAPR